MTPIQSVVIVTFATFFFTLLMAGVQQFVRAQVTPDLGGENALDELAGLLGIGNNNSGNEDQDAHVSILPGPVEFDPNGTLTRVNATISNYTNTEHGFTFLLPSNWNQTDPGLLGTMSLHTVQIEGPESVKDPHADIINILYDTAPTFTVTIHPTESYLDPETMTVKNYTIEEFANSDINALESIQYSPRGSVASSADITKSQPQGDAWKIEYIKKVNNRQTTFGILVLVQDPQSGNLYKLDFSSPVLEAPKYVPIINKMIESFRFL